MLKNAKPPQTPRQWVLLRGMMSESFHWWDFLPLLKSHFPRDDFHTADLLGNGRFGQQITPVKVARNVQALKDQVTVPGKKILVGFSLGAMMALEWAYAHPEDVEAVVLINCSLSSMPAYRRLRPGALVSIFKFSAFAKGLQKDIESLALTTSLPLERCTDLAPHWYERHRVFPVKPINFFSQLALAWQVPMRPLPPPMPVLMIASQNDRVVHPECSERISKAWNLPLHMHPTAGHDLSLADPEWLVGQLSQWAHLREFMPADEPEFRPKKNPPRAPSEPPLHLSTGP